MKNSSPNLNFINGHSGKSEIKKIQINSETFSLWSERHTRFHNCNSVFTFPFVSFFIKFFFCLLPLAGEVMKIALRAAKKSFSFSNRRKWEEKHYNLSSPLAFYLIYFQVTFNKFFWFFFCSKQEKLLRKKTYVTQSAFPFFL